MVVYVFFEAAMKISDIVLDTVAEIAAFDLKSVGQSTTLGLEEVIFALCTDSGLSVEELNLALESRILRIRAERARLRMLASEN